MSHHLRHSRHLPHDVAVKLAEDVEAVALPILTDSLVLIDNDLIAVLSRGSPVKHKAIATRTHLSQQVSDAVITLADAMAVSTLMHNSTAQINAGSFEKAIDRFKGSDEVKESMALRPSLPPAIAECLVDLVSDRLQDYLAAHHKLSTALAAEIMTRSRERALIQLSADMHIDEIEGFVDQLHSNQRLTPVLVLRALCVSNLPFFEYAMAVLAKIPVVSARQLIQDTQPGVFEALAGKAEIPASLMRVMCVALRVLSELELDGQDNDLKCFRNRIIELILTETQDLDPKDQDYLLALIK